LDFGWFVELLMGYLGSPVIIVQVCSHSSDSGSFQFSHSPAKVNGRPFLRMNIGIPIFRPETDQKVAKTAGSLMYQLPGAFMQQRSKLLQECCCR
jgi:hypothetical protein